MSERGVVGAGHPAEAEAAVRMFEAGGTAIDALVAAAFTAFVVEPTNCGPGGYGHLAMFLADSAELVTIDHSLRAPHGSRPDLFAVEAAAPGAAEYEWPDVAGDRNSVGALAVGVPGAVAGLCAAHERAGRLPFPQVLEPAIELAEAGLDVTWNLVLVMVERLDEIRRAPVAAQLLLRNGEVPRAAGYSGPGDRLDTSELAATLRRIAQEGAAGFYSGPVAAAVERELAAAGGILTAADLKAYRPRILHERPGRYRGHDYVTANDQVGYEVLNILERYPLADYGPRSATVYHLLAEAFGHAFADNALHYGDPEHVASPVNGLASPEFAEWRAAVISTDRAAARPIAPADPWPFETEQRRPERLPTTPSAGGVGGTTQIAVADAEGNMAALITTIGADFGSLVLAPGTGVFLNNGMGNFDPRPDRPNSIAPGKMPFFAVPSIVAVREGRAVFAACGSGGYPILSSVVHATVNALAFGMPVESAVAEPRVYCQGRETFVDARIPAEVCSRLEELGHTVVRQTPQPGFEPFARVSAVAADPRTGRRSAASDPVWSTAAAGSAWT